jgi:CheY-like chemotaxis protein
MRHPNIVTVYDFGGLPDGRLYLVMELLAGPTLERWIEQNGKATPAQALEILRPVCRAIAALHRQDVVHRDLKPANIVMPDPNDPDDALKVVDFGIARLRDAAGPKLTGNTVLGTPEYLAPEIVDGEEADARTDLYALGVIAYHLFTGRLPFTGSTAGSILMQHLTKNPPKPSSIDASLSPAVDALLLRALEKTPSDRFQSADEFASALESAIAPPQALAAAAAAVATPIAEVPAAAKTASILVIDDEEDLRTINRVTLEEAGYAVTTAGDGIEALLAVGGGAFDLILSDVDMPNLDGFTLLGMLSQKGITTPVIFLTGRVDPENELKGLELGAADYLHKPVPPTLLQARVRLALAKRGR